MNIQDLIHIFETLGIGKGDNVLVSSDVMRLLQYLCADDRKKLRSSKAKAAILDEIIDGLQKLVGEDGTLLFPTYNWGFCHGETFDYCKTQGLTGMLSNQALSRNDFKRTKHPIYSFAVWGKGTNELERLENIESFSQDSPFAWLHRNNGKNLTIDASLYFTFMHYVEESCGMTYRFIKNFTSQYIDKNGVEETRTYSMYVRDLDLVVTYDQDLYESYLKSLNVMRSVNVYDMNFDVTELSKAYPYLKDDMINNKSGNIIKSIERV